MDTNHNKKPVEHKAAAPAATAPVAAPKAATPAAANAAAPVAPMAQACATTTHNKVEACSSEKSESKAHANTHDGKVVSISGNKLVMTSQAGQQHSHTVAVDAKVCCDGTACRTQDLKVGSKIRLTTQQDDKNIAVRIESLDKNTEFAQSA
jgi:hypothetical protein